MWLPCVGFSTLAFASLSSARVRFLSVPMVALSEPGYLKFGACLNS